MLTVVESLCSCKYLHVKKFAESERMFSFCWVYMRTRPSIFIISSDWNWAYQHWEKQWPLIWISSVPSVQHMPSIFLSFHTFQASSEVMLQYFSLKVSECGSAASSWAFIWRTNSKLVHHLSVSVRGCRWQKMFASHKRRFTWAENSKKKKEREWVLFSWHESLFEHTNSTTQTLLSSPKSQTFKALKAIPLTQTNAVLFIQ